MMQNFKSKLFGSIVTGAFLMAASGTDASHSSGRIIIAQQGSFFVGDATIRAPGEFDPTDPNATDAGRLFPIDQMYVQYQIPPHPRKYPLVLIHGGGLTGKSWETTADGREGYQTIFLRRGFSVYIVDFPRRGRAGFPSFNGRLGALLDQQVIPDQTGRSSEEVMFMQFRLGPKFLEFFPNSQFPKAGLDQYFQQGIPFVSDDTDVVTGAIVALLDRIGPAILVGHSQSSLFACLAAIKSPNVVGIVEYEGALHPFPAGERPDPIPDYAGRLFGGGPAIAPADFERLTRVPINLVEGDNFPSAPVPNLLLDIQRIRSYFREQFVTVMQRHQADVSFVRLPEIGISGNTHFAFSDLNNLEVADLMSRFLHEKRLNLRAR